MNCDCHGLPMRWNKDGRRRAGGYWRCDFRWKQTLRHRYATDSGYRAKKIQRASVVYHRADGGYIQRRKRQLAAGRKKILEQLNQLQKEAEFA